MNEIPEYDLKFLTLAGMDALLEFLPYFQNKRSRFGKEPDVENHVHRPSLLSKKAIQFIGLCETTHFIQPFDWGAWIQDHPRVANRGDGIEELSLEELGKLLTAHVRGDRFCDGHLLEVMRSGQMARLLERLLQLREPRRIAEAILKDKKGNPLEEGDAYRIASARYSNIEPATQEECYGLFSDRVTEQRRNAWLFRVERGGDWIGGSLYIGVLKSSGDVFEFTIGE